MAKLYLHSFQSILGTIRLASTANGLAVIHLPHSTQGAFESAVHKLFSNHQFVTGGTINKRAEQQLTEFLDGTRRSFSLKLDILAPPFYKKVLEAVARIPYGETRTYGEVARLVGSPRACRAVGTANANNNLPLVIPCHRVVAADSIGGYGGGLHIKKTLLELEGAL